MTTARRGAARLRGVCVGAASMAVAVAAHGSAGAELPATSSMVLLVLCAAMVGAVASSPSEAHRRLPVLVAYLAGGQTVGHCLLTFTAGHHHGGSHATLPMLVAHGVAALVLAVLIGTAERSLAALAGVLWRLILVGVALRGTDACRRPRPLWWGAGLRIRILPGSGLGTRGPPSFTAA
ncbi:hypothetical protein [Mycolicibacterium grossiae]|uniref:MFS transporter n=1 Tax=Mycolicibacterium grossiae TaxID=1552759 RepID=A0A1E8Q5Q6_9MYCO|nr:hypothetical protein [Mycolicibacterium grossiae]OFJ53903.1 hypothetical protein BEL07_10290 [Mycolicibacterium grossiae]QEM47669.1 hypothetical protein FZ046_25480 [Mycolicibacterium grossiae]